MGHAIAKTYTIKDRVMDDERIKRGTYLTDKYCKEQLERIRDVSQNSKPHEPFPFCEYISVSCKKEIRPGSDAVHLNRDIHIKHRIQPELFWIDRHRKRLARKRKAH